MILFTLRCASGHGDIIAPDVSGLLRFVTDQGQ